MRLQAPGGQNKAVRTGDERMAEQWGDLLAATQRGDRDAYHRFLSAIAPFVRALVRKRIRAHDAIEDVVQEVLLTVHRVRHTYEPGRPVEPWLAAIVARRSIDSLRKHGRRAAREVHDSLAYETHADPAANRLSDDGAARTLAGMMGTLSPKQKEALELVKLKQLSLAEASLVSGQSVSSLKVNVHRAIKRLRLALPKGRPE